MNIEQEMQVSDLSDLMTDADGTCDEHGPYAWFCKDCHDLWEARNPRTAQAISVFAAGRGSTARVSAARTADRAARSATPIV